MGVYQGGSGGRLWSGTATEPEKQKGSLPWEEQDVALSHICHVLVFQGNRALEEDIWEPILAAWLRPWQGKGALMSTATPLPTEFQVRKLLEDDSQRSSAGSFSFFILQIRFLLLMRRFQIMLAALDHVNCPCLPAPEIHLAFQEALFAFPQKSDPSLNLRRMLRKHRFSQHDCIRLKTSSVTFMNQGQCPFRQPCSSCRESGQLSLPAPSRHRPRPASSSLLLLTRCFSFTDRTTF